MSITTSKSSSPDPSRHRRGALSKFAGLAAALLGLLFLMTAGGAVAQSVEVSGELDVIITSCGDEHAGHDHAGHHHGPSEFDYFLRDDDGQNWYQLEFKRTPPGHLRSGQRLRVRGQPQGRKFQVEALSEDGSATPQSSGGLPNAHLADERKAVVLLVNLTNATAGQSRSQVIGHMFTNTRSVDQLYRAASLGQTSFPADTDGDGQPDVFGPFNIPHDNSNCRYYDWAYAAESAAQAAGVDLSRYRHRVFVLPNTSNLPACSWAGIANVGCGTFCRAWIAGSTGMIYAHELGHNLNLAHAGTDPENDGTINSVYGDRSDPMGSSSSSWYVFNGPHLDQMGWYAGIPGAVAAVTSGGAYELAAIGLDPWTSGAPAALKIYKPDTKDYYYLSYRQPIGDFGQLATTYTKGINIHRYRGSGYGRTAHITTLVNGAAFNDSVNGITFYQVGTVDNYASVQVSFGCAPTPPKVALAPATLTMKPGAVASFTVSVTNRDSGGCGAGSFLVDDESDLSGSVAPNVMTLSAGETGAADLTANASGAADGSYQVRVAVSPTDGAQSGVTASATLIVDGTPPSIPTGLAGSVNRQGRVSLSWSASSDALSGVAGYTVYRDGAVLGQPTTTSFTDSSTTAGASYQYTVSARDGAGNVSAESTAVTVTISGGGGGGNRKK